MAAITFKGNPIHTVGTLPAVNTVAPAFNLTKTDLTELNSKDLTGKKTVLNIFPSVDTGVCAASVRAFNKAAAALSDTQIICISADLPFALARFCGAEGLDKVVSASSFRNPEFGDAYGVRIVDGPLAGLLSRAVVVIDAKGQVVYSEQVEEITHEPNYKAALDALK